LSTLAVSDLCQAKMPHSLQSLREFWQSSAPIDLENYLRASGKVNEANALHGCGPGNLVTLDPPSISSLF
jgi:hypothetical protein